MKFAKLFDCADDFQLVVQKSFDDDGPCLKCSTMNLDGLHVLELEIRLKKIKPKN